jgi:hypothetical protein
MGQQNIQNYILNIVGYFYVKYKLYINIVDGALPRP